MTPMECTEARQVRISPQVVIGIHSNQDLGLADLEQLLEACKLEQDLLARDIDSLQVLVSLERGLL